MKVSDRAPTVELPPGLRQRLVSFRRRLRRIKVAEAAFAIEMQASAEDLGRTTHNHPTLSEVVKEAALAAWDKPIHG